MKTMILAALFFGFSGSTFAASASKGSICGKYTGSGYTLELNFDQEDKLTSSVMTGPNGTNETLTQSVQSCDDPNDNIPCDKKDLYLDSADGKYSVSILRSESGVANLFPPGNQWVNLSCAD